MALRTIDSDSWLIRKMVVIKRTWSDKELPASEYTFRGPDNAYYAFSKAPEECPPTTPFTQDCQIRLLGGTDSDYEQLTFMGSWVIGDFLIKLRRGSSTRTPEAKTLAWLNDKMLSFSMPRLLYSAEDTRDPGMSVIVTTRVPGEVLASVWHDLDEKTKDYYVRQVVNIYQELAQFTSDRICGVDGKYVWSGWLSKCAVKCSQQRLIANCRDIGMKCDKFHFVTLNIALSQIMVRTDKKEDIAKAVANPEYTPEEPLVGLINFELTGYYPIEWIPTWASMTKGIMPGFTDEFEFRGRIAKEFDARQMKNVTQEWKAWKERWGGLGGLVWSVFESFGERER